MTYSVEILKRRADFLRVASAKKSVATPGLVIQARVTSDKICAKNPNVIRVGYTATKKIGNAVTRNRARRKLRALVGEIFPAHAQFKHDYVIIARYATAPRSHDKLKRDMRRALKQLDLWRM